MITFGQDFPLSYFQNKYSGKLTFNVLQGTSIVGSVFSDSQTQQGALPASRRASTRSRTRPPRHGRTRLRRSVEPALRLVRHLHVPVRPAQGPVQHEAAGPRLPAVRDYNGVPTASPSCAPGGFGSVFGPTVNNASKRESYSGSFTAYVQNHEIKIGGDFQNDATFGTTYYTGQGTAWRPCLQTGSSVCDLSLAPIYDEPARPSTSDRCSTSTTCSPTAPRMTSRSSGRRRSTPRPSVYAGYIQDQWRILPTLTMNVGVRYDSETFSVSRLIPRSASS